MDKGYLQIRCSATSNETSSCPGARVPICCANMPLPDQTNMFWQNGRSATSYQMLCNIKPDFFQSKGTSTHVLGKHAPSKPKNIKKGVLSKKSSNLLHCNIKQDLLRSKGMRTPQQKQKVEKIVNKEEDFSASKRFVTSNHLFPSRADAQVAKLILVTTSFQSFQDLVKFSSVSKSGSSFLQLLSRSFCVSRQLILRIKKIHKRHFKRQWLSKFRTFRTNNLL